MSILRQLERRGATGPWGDSSIPTNGQLGMPAAGVQVNDDTAMSLTTVAGAISMISDAGSALPLLALKNTKDRSKKLIDPPPPLIANPWPEGTRQDWLTQVIFSLGLRGNAFGRLVSRDSDGYPTSCMLVHPDSVNARRSYQTGNRIYRFGGEVVPTEDVMHIRGSLLPPGGFCAFNPVEYQRLTWGNALASVRASGQFFANSATPSGILSTEQDLDEDELKEWARGWNSAHQGLNGMSMPAFLTGGATWTQVSVTPEAGQWLATRQFLREEILTWFHISPAKFGLVETRTPMEDIQSQFMADAVLPYLSRIEAWFSRPEITRPSQRARFDLSSMLRASTLQRMQSAQIGANTGLYTTDELRAIEDKEPLPNGMGAVIQRPMNMIAYDVNTGLPVAGQQQDPSLKPDNPGGVGGGGGDPASSPGMTKPDGL